MAQDDHLTVSDRQVLELGCQEHRLLTADGLLEERRVEAGLANWEYTEIRAGLARGDRVVASLERAGVKAGARATEEKKAEPKPVAEPVK